MLLNDVEIFSRFPWHSGSLSIEGIEICSNPRSGRPLNPGFKSVVRALIAMDHWNIFFAGNFSRFTSWNKKLDSTWFVANWSVDDIFTAEIKMDDSIDTLSLIPNKERDFGVFILIEFGDLALQNGEIVRIKLVDEQNKGSFGVLNQLVGFSAGVNHFGELVKMLDGNMQHLLRITSLKHLLLDSHQHEVKKLRHRALVQSHNTRVRQLDKNLSCFNQRVHWLRLEDLFHELLREHGLDDILEDFLTLVSCHLLGPQSLLQNEDHFTA